jgi:hypothetical protein
MTQKRYSDENELRGDGGYQGVSSNQFSYSSGSKAVEITNKIFGFYGVELFTNGSLKVPT